MMKKIIFTILFIIIAISITWFIYPNQDNNSLSKKEKTPPILNTKLKAVIPFLKLKKKENSAADCTKETVEKCTNEDIYTKALTFEQFWTDKAKEILNSECEKEKNGESCILTASLYYVDENIEKTKQYFENACKLGLKEGCCNVIWLTEGRSANSSDPKSLKFLNSFMDTKECLFEDDAADSIVFGVTDQIEFRNDLKTNEKKYINMLLLACEHKSVLACHTAGELLRELKKPAKMIAQFYKLSCEEGLDESCEKYQKEITKFSKENVYLLGEPNQEMNTYYSIEVEINRKAWGVRSRVLPFTYLGFYSFAAPQIHLTLVGKFKTYEEAQAFKTKHLELLKERHPESLKIIQLTEEKT